MLLTGRCLTVENEGFNAASWPYLKRISHFSDLNFIQDFLSTVPNNLSTLSWA